MKLNRLNIESEITQKSGIDEINIDRLNTVVALIGRNGSGKTRILNLLEQNIQSIFIVNRFLDNSISNPPKILNNIIKNLSPYKKYLLILERLQILQKKQATNPNDQEVLNYIDNVQNSFKALQEKYNQKKNRKDKVIFR